MTSMATKRERTSQATMEMMDNLSLFLLGAVTDCENVIWKVTQTRDEKYPIYYN